MSGSSKKSTKDKRILVVRLSALGDVAILAPVVKARAKANRNCTFLVAAPAKLEPLFNGVENIQFVPTTKKQSSKQLYNQWCKLKPTIVADMHHVNRVIGADLLFLMHGVPVKHIKKEKIKRHRMMRRIDKDHSPLTPSWKRYDMVFDACGLEPSNIEENATTPWPIKQHPFPIRIGIAPTAQHKGKIWPIDKMERLLGLLTQSKKYKIQLFGGPDETEMFEKWTSQFENTESMACKMSFAEELKSIGQLDLMLCMDSANMHFASAMGIPVISIWGATHPDAGFYGWRQSKALAIQKSMHCRPCSTFGNKPCHYGHYKCLGTISPENVFQQIESVFAQARFE